MKQVQIDNLQRNVPFDTQMRGNMTQAVQSVFYTVKGVTAPLEVQISLVGPRAMRRLNRESRNIDRETDVLSFPYLNWEGATPGDFTTLAEPPHGQYAETGRILMGGYRHFHAPHSAAGGGIWPQPDARGVLSGSAWRAAPLGVRSYHPGGRRAHAGDCTKILSTLGIFRD